MRTLTHKRVLSAVLATGLAASAMVALAATSDAATAKLKADATTSAGAILTITGTDLVDDNGVPQFDVLGIRYSTATCASAPATAAATNTGYTSGSAANSATAVSDTKLTVSTDAFTPTLVAGKAKYNVCVYDASGALFGSTTTTFYAPPATITAGVATLAASPLGIFVGSTGVDSSGALLAGPSLGGTKISVKGLDFTAKTYVTVGGVKLNAAKTTVAKVSTDADVITGTVPPGTGTKPIKIVGEFGTYPLAETGVSSAAALNWAYSPAISVSPSGSNGASGNVITVKGVGFNARTFAAAPAASSSAVVLVRAGTSLATATFYSSGYTAATASTPFQFCGSPNVISDTELTCTLTTALTSTRAGAYTAVVVTYDASNALVAANTTGYSRGATYTSALY